MVIFPGRKRAFGTAADYRSDWGYAGPCSAMAASTMRIQVSAFAITSCRSRASSFL
jgi:hypothetical protein